MPIKKNIAITGSKGAGKSTLANWLLGEIKLTYDGFRTQRYGLTPMGPLYELVEITTGKSAPISQFLEGNIQGIPRTFDTFGVDLLKNTCQPVLLLDEVGRFERSCGGFLGEIFAALDSNRTVIAVLKQEDLPHIRKIKEREDTYFVDLDQISRETARKQLTAWLQNRKEDIPVI